MVRPTLWSINPGAVLPWVVACAGMARATGRRPVPRVDSHIHLWTPDEGQFPWETAPPEHLNSDGRATHDNFVKLMDEAGVAKAVVVQPINYGQDYKYLSAAMDAHPDRLRGVFVADPTAPGPAEAAARLESLAASRSGWVGVRFNPYKWPEGASMADEKGMAMFRKAGELGLVVGFMPFKGLSQHVADIEALLISSPQTKVIIDHWGFFLQPATGSGERELDERSWQSLLKLSEYPQVFVKISALFRVSSDSYPWQSLSDRLGQLLSSFGSSRLLWGSDFPYASEHSSYSAAVHSLEDWPIWREMSETDRQNLVHDTASRLYHFPELGSAQSENPEL